MDWNEGLSNDFPRATIFRDDLAGILWEAGMRNLRLFRRKGVPVSSKVKFPSFERVKKFLFRISRSVLRVRKFGSVEKIIGGIEDLDMISYKILKF